ncbi:hypothetical protein TYRP_021032 [Tyrophagus putrescentiae]|nr:hypothetical protein TYRP_021032 [Tyrophagus putrescentiae]
MSLGQLPPHHLIGAHSVAVVLLASGYPSTAQPSGCRRFAPSKSTFCNGARVLQAIGWLRDSSIVLRLWQRTSRWWAPAKGSG